MFTPKFKSSQYKTPVVKNTIIEDNHEINYEIVNWHSNTHDKKSDCDWKQQQKPQSIIWNNCIYDFYLDKYDYDVMAQNMIEFKQELLANIFEPTRLKIMAETYNMEMREYCCAL